MEIMEMDQKASEYEKQVNKIVNNVKRWTGGHGFTSGVSPINKILICRVNKLQLGNWQDYDTNII